MELKRPPRITPAYAGSSPYAARPSTLATDHPRIRGEQSVGMDIGPVGPGSPPHTRGAVPTPRVRPCLQRITPAYAGSSEHTTRLWFQFPDHPRIRGEQH